MSVKHSVLKIPGTAMPQEDPLPRFRDREYNKYFESDGTLSCAELERLGEHTGFRVLPYCMQNTFTTERTLREYKTLVLENEYLRAEFLPQLGGRLYSLFDKEKKRELLFKNPVFQPGNLAIRDAWFSGGVEWNIGQTGHTYTTCDDVYFAQMNTPDGEEFLRMYEYLRTTGLFWQVDFHLPKDARALYVHVRIHNDLSHAVPLYWWTNTAIPEEKRVRVFSGTGEVIYINPKSLEQEGAPHGYAHAQLPELPSMPGVDVTYPENSDYTNEFFFQNGSDVRCPWEAAAYDDGFLFLERSTQPLRTRKMFCWGSHFGGRNWTDFLSEPGKGAYVEIQAGLTPTQIHGADLAVGQTIEFTQAFSCAGLDSSFTHTADWYAAKDAVEQAVCATLTAETLEEHDLAFSAAANLPCGDLLHLGSGWGYLESERRRIEREQVIPESVCFPREAMGKEELSWLGLLSDGALPPLTAEALPRSWMTDPRWRPYLEQSLAANPKHNSPRIHLGALLYENGQEERAVELWTSALALEESAIARRNLATAYLSQGKAEEALGHMGKAFFLCPKREIAREYLSLLNQIGEYERAWAVYCGLPEKAAADERVMITAAAAALEVGAEDFLQKVFAYPFAVIREGENQMVDIWFRHQAQQKAAHEGRDDVKAVELELRAAVRPPRNIDYRLTQA